MTDGSPNSPTAPLEELLVNERVAQGRQAPGTSAEDEDLKLAMILQEQERAFMALASGTADLGNYFGGAAPLENYPPGRAGASASPATVMPQQASTGAAAEENSVDAEQGGAAGALEAGEEVALTDEELAARLQAEEEAEFQARLLALAGVAPPGALFGGAGAEGIQAEEEGYLSEDAIDPDQLTYEQLTALGETVGTVSRGLSAAAIKALPLSTYGELQAARRATPPPGQAGAAASAQEGEEEQCPVCRLEFEAPDVLRLLPCRHFYHPECIGEWLRHNKVCCVCNKEVEPEGSQQQAQQQHGTGSTAADRRAPLDARSQ